MNILRPKATAVKCGVVTITVNRWATDPKYADMGFPKPFPLGANSVGFIEEEVDAWLEARADARLEAPAAERDDVDADGNDADGEDDEGDDDQDEAA